MGAGVYTQVIKFSQVLTGTPPNPQNWGGTRISKSPRYPRYPQNWGSRGQGSRGLNRPKRIQVGLVCTP